MAAEIDQILQSAQDALDRQESELQALRARQILSVVVATATGSGNLGELFQLDEPFRLIFLRCHYTGTVGTNPLHLSVDSVAGSAYDTRLFTVSQAGIDRDVNLRIAADEMTEPSAWTFQAGDRLRVEWVNPDTGNITWGLEVGLALAS